MKKGTFYLFAMLILLIISCSNSVEQNDAKNESLFEVNKTEGDPSGTTSSGTKWCSIHSMNDKCG